MTIGQENKKINRKHSLLAGLTGSIATGKTLVASYFEQSGAYVIEADKIYSDLTMPNTRLLKLITLEFGNFILHEDGSLNRKRLASLVFDSEDHRIKLNRITHPFILNTIIEKINSAENKDIIIISAPLIIESNILKIFDYLLVVVCKIEQQIERLVARDNILKEEAQKRISSQLTSEEKIKYADFVIDNSRSKDNTYQQTLAIYNKLLKEFHERK